MIESEKLDHGAGQGNQQWIQRVEAADSTRDTLKNDAAMEENWSLRTTLDANARDVCVWSWTLTWKRARAARTRM